MAGKPIRALVVDFGGVLDDQHLAGVRGVLRAEGLAPETVRELFRGDAAALKLLRGLETGEICRRPSSNGVRGACSVSPTTPT